MKSLDLWITTPIVASIALSVWFEMKTDYGLGAIFAFFVGAIYALFLLTAYLWLLVGFIRDRVQK